MNETKSMDGIAFNNLDPKSGLIDPAALRNMAELKAMIENMRQSSQSDHENSLETPYISYEEVYPSKKGINLSLTKQSEKKFWQELVDSNIRAGTIACMWCLKAQGLKRLSVAFNKWKVFSAVKTQELILRESQEMHKSEVSTAIDNALSIIRRYKEGGIMNQLSQSRDWRGSNDLAFPWEERRQQQAGLTAAGILGLGDHVSSSGASFPQYFEANHSSYTVPQQPPPDLHPSPLQDKLQSSSRDWNFQKSQFRSTDISDIQTERQHLLALSYDIIKRAEVDRSLITQQTSTSRPASASSSPRDFMPPISTDVSKRSSLNLLAQDPSESTKPFSPQGGRQGTSPTHQFHQHTSPLAQHSLRASSSSPSHRENGIPRTASDEFNYHVNEPAGLFPSKGHLSPTNGQPAGSRGKPIATAAAPSSSRFPENTLRIAPDQRQAQQPQPQPQHQQHHQHHQQQHQQHPTHSEQHVSREHRNHNGHNTHAQQPIPPQYNTHHQTEPRERGRSSTPSQNRTPSSGTRRSTSANSSTKNKRPAASASPSRKPYSEKTLVDVIKFRNTKEGSYVKDLLSPRYPGDMSALDAKRSSVFDESAADYPYTSDAVNQSYTSSMMPRSGSKARSVSPTDKPRYLLPTNSYRKKMVSNEEAQMIKEKQEREKQLREQKIRGSRGASNRHNDFHDHDRDHHHPQPDHSYHHNSQNDFSKSRLSASYDSIPQPGHSSGNGSQYPHPPQYPYTSQVPSTDHHFPQSAGIPESNANPNPQRERPSGDKDAEYEYYEKLLKEQQQQFLNYQAQTATRAQTNNNSSLLAPHESSSLSTNTGALPSQSQSHFPNNQLNGSNPEYLSFNQYSAQMLDHPHDNSLLSNAQQFHQPQVDFANASPSDFPSMYQPQSSPNPHSSQPSYYENSMDPVYSLNPNYYTNPKNLQANIQSFSPNEQYQQGYGPDEGYNAKRVGKRSSPNKKMDKAQRMLLYGVLHDVLDAKKAWQKNLRR